MLHLAPLEAIARTVVTALAFGIVESALLAAVVACAIRCSRGNATTRHVLWWIVFVAAAALPIASVAASFGRIEHRQLGALAHTSALPEIRVMRVRPVQPSGGGPIQQPSDRATPPPGALRKCTALVASIWLKILTLPYVATALLGVWLCVSGLALSALFRSLASLRRLKDNAAPLDESFLRRLRRWWHSARTGRPVIVKVTPDVDVPVAVGFGRPAILLPARLVEHHDIADLDQIAMHEYAHLNRYDDWSNLAQRAIERLFWCNPIVALVGKRIALEREIACDDWVVARTGRAHRYATCLWKLVETSQLPARPIVAPGALLTAPELTIRIERLLDSRRNALPRLSPFGATAVGALCALLVTVQVLRAPAIAIVDVPMASTQPIVAAPGTHVDRAALEDCPGCNLRDADLRKLDLHGIALAGVDLRGADLRGANLRGAKLTGTSLRGAHLQGADLRGVSFIGCDLAGADLSGASLDGAHLVGTSIRFTNVAGARLRSLVDGCEGCDLRGLNLHDQDLRNITLVGVDLRDADLSDADLRGARLEAVDLRGANVAGLMLAGAVLLHCDVRGLALPNAHMERGSATR